MKVLLINGSPKHDGNTATCLKEVAKTLETEGLKTEIVTVGNKNIRGCIACGSCVTNGKCVFDDAVNDIAEKFKEADGIVVGSPVYYASANGTLVSFLDRLFYSTHFDKTMKVGASIAVARRGGTTATFDELNKYFTISNMVVAASSYWNIAHGAKPGEVSEDEEGLSTMRNLGRNIAFLIKSIKLGKETFGLPDLETSARTNFIR